MKKIRKYLHQNETVSFNGKLAAYSAAVTGAMLASASGAQAGVVFTPQNPDSTTLKQTGASNASDVGGSFDLNNDGVSDIELLVHTGTYTGGSIYYGAIFAVIPTGNGLVGSLYYNSATQKMLPVPVPLNAGDTIGRIDSVLPSPYGGNNQEILGLAEIEMTSSGSASANIGKWLNEKDKYLGVQFLDSDGQPHYGWLKMSTHVVSDTSYATFLEGYAYETVANKPIIAGDTVGALIPFPADTVSNILGHDIGNNNNGSDLEVTFKAAADQSTIGSYRVIVVRDVDAAGFNLDSANAVATANYQSVAVDTSTSNYAVYLSASATDAEGIAIQNGVPYVIFVLDIADGVNATYNSLSGPSPVITLQTTAIVAADTASSIIASQVNANDNGSALHVSFTKATNESTVGSYRVIVVEETSAAAFNLTAANNTSNYKQLAKTAGDSVTLSSTATDAEGNPIHDSVAYQVFVLNVADGVNATENSLSSPSAPITLEPVLGISSIEELQNVDLYSFGSSVYLNFKNVSNTSGILRVYNTLGQQVYASLVSGDQKIDLNTVEGVYLVSLTQGNKLVRKMLYISNQ